ncbi:hypothetical protein N474_08035 [Pseudoalteromonas luteoviolacea CPMOR-2]|uniref:Uncharacterized protein n=1 Tax=Pseudoalteromonas luteoviolacea DSM 6061 TaxID=1365250 RepID=A0A166YTN8_9GAMM|nr:hypothetical protein N475_08890 [Pseudoalteromonas luteoviolacea DSM 6061]KZN57349.1 hypothetical protein N474_08035 [Pseudoalteromonas luteoviolacea CPMOR-2]
MRCEGEIERKQATFLWFFIHLAMIMHIGLFQWKDGQ